MKSKPQFENVMFRLKEAIGIANDKELCNKLRLSPSAFSNRKSTLSIPYENVLDLAGAENLNLNWVFWGEGSPRSDAYASDLPIDIQGALIDENLLGIISLRVEEDFDLSKSNTQVFLDKITEFLAKNRGKSLGTDARGELLSILAEEEKWRKTELFEKTATAATVYNEAVKKKIGKHVDDIKSFLDVEVPRHINFLKLVRSLTDKGTIRNE